MQTPGLLSVAWHPAENENSVVAHGQENLGQVLQSNGLYHL